MSRQLAKVNFFSPVEYLLPEVEARMQEQARGFHPDLGIALNHLLSSGGKRVRPAVTLLTGKMLGAEDHRLVTLSAAIELLHTATLVHDDLIDGALLRRGMTTLNAQWSPAATVLTGDFVFARAAKLAAETDSVAVMHIFAETLTTIVNGEITQLFSSRRVASREDYEQRIYAKTASMFVLATVASALLSPVEEPMLEKARQYGHKIGMAFQIVDDVLDFTGEQATVGKPVGGDLRQGLITLPALYYLEANPQDPGMQAVMAGNHYNERMMDALVASVAQSQAIGQALDEARTYVEDAQAVLQEMPACEERDALHGLAGYIVSRTL